MLATTSSPREKNRPWFLGWLTQWKQQRKHREDHSSMTLPSPRSQSNKRFPQEHLCWDDNSKVNAGGMVPIRRTSTNQSTSTSMTADTSSQQQQLQQQQQQRRLARHVPQHRLSFHIPLTTTTTATTPSPISERRNSQQTTNSSILSDDQYSSSSCHRRNSSERSILGDLWSRTRKHHPHYPRFHWPHYHSWRYNRRRHHHRHHLFDGEEIAHSVGGTPRRSHDELLINHDTSSAQQQYESPQHLASSYQEPQHQFLQTTTADKKRHSVTSLTSGEISLGSRPASIFCSQPGSPVFAALLKNGLLCDGHENDDVESYWLDSEDGHFRQRWIIKPELVQLAMDDGLFCSPVNISPSAIATEKHVLHVGCGDGIWAMDVARSYPKWIVVGMDDMDGGPPPIRRFAPRNFKFIRCHDTLLESLKNIQSDSFDLVHCRFLAMSYTAEQYQQLVKECWRVCKPGGFVELLEMDMRIYYCRALVGQVTQTFNSEVIHAMESKSLDPRIARRFKDILSEAAALQNDNEEHRTIYQGGYISLPLGVWGGRLGVMFRDNVRELFEQFQPTIAEFKQTDARSDNELEDAFELMDHEMEAQEAFMNLHHAFAQKL